MRYIIKPTPQRQNRSNKIVVKLIRGPSSGLGSGSGSGSTTKKCKEFSFSFSLYVNAFSLEVAQFLMEDCTVSGFIHAQNIYWGEMQYGVGLSQYTVRFKMRHITITNNTNTNTEITIDILSSAQNVNARTVMYVFKQFKTLFEENICIINSSNI